MLGTSESTAAPPFVITFTICSSDFVFLIPDVASFLSVEELTGAPRLGEASFLGESAFFAVGTFEPLRGVIFGVGALGGDTFAAFLGFESAFPAFPPFPAFPFVATTFYGLLALSDFPEEGGREADREFFLSSLLLEVAGSAFLAYTLACLALALGGIL